MIVKNRIEGDQLYVSASVSARFLDMCQCRNNHLNGQLNFFRCDLLSTYVEQSPRRCGEVSTSSRITLQDPFLTLVFYAHFTSQDTNMS